MNCGATVSLSFMSSYLADAGGRTSALILLAVALGARLPVRREFSSPNVSEWRMRMGRLWRSAHDDDLSATKVDKGNMMELFGAPGS